MSEFLEPLEVVHFIFLMLGIVAHSVVKLYKFTPVVGGAKEKFSFKKWWQLNGRRTTASILLTIIIWVVASHEPGFLEWFGLVGFTKANIFMLGFGFDGVIKGLIKKRESLGLENE